MVRRGAVTVKAKSSTVIRLAMRIGGTLILTLSLALLAGCFFTDIPDNPSIQLPMNMYVDAESGNDVSGDGTLTNPFRTITKALTGFYDLAGATEDISRAGIPLTLHVARGIYNKNLGEEDPILLNNVILKGEGTLRDAVKITVSISVVGACKIEHLYCYDGLRLSQKNDWTPPNAEAIIDDVHADMVYVDYFKPGVTIIDSELRAIQVMYASGSVTVQACRLSANGGVSAISISSQEQVTIADNVIVGDYIYGITAYTTAQEGIIVADNTVAGCNWGGITVGADGTEAILRRNVISGCNRGPGISISSETDNTLESNTVTGCRIGLSIVGETSNTVTVIGDNTITGSSDYNLLDARLAHSGPLVIRGIMWDNPQPSGRIDGPTLSIPGSNYHIENEGNSLIF